MKNESFDLEQRITELEGRVSELATSLHNHLMYTTPCGPVKPRIEKIEPLPPMTEPEAEEFLARWNELIEKRNLK